MIAKLNYLDFIIIGIILLSVLLGVIKGFIREIFSLAFLIIGIVVGFLFYKEVGRWLSSILKNKELANFLGFVAIFIVILIIGSVVTYLVKKVLIRGPLKSVDRILGGVLGLIRGYLISAVMIFALVFFSMNDQLINQSKLAPLIIKSNDFLIKLLPKKEKKDIKKYIVNHGKETARIG